MNVLRGPWGDTARRPAGPSPLACALPRLRQLREKRAWEPVTPPSTVGQRALRVREAQGRVVYHPVPPERLPEWDPPAWEWSWLPDTRGARIRCAGLLVVLVAAVAWTVWRAAKGD